MLAYPKTFASSISCKKNFEEKRKLFTALPSDRMTIITPSRWLADLVQQSYLSKYPIKVRYNTIDKSIFKPTPSDFREKFGIGNRFMILGVAYPWNDRKGLADFIKLAHELDSDRFVVVLIGLNEGQIANCRDELVALPRTENRTELAKVYSAANVFFNPTVEDNYPTVNLEAESCKTPVITYDTGGCAETIHLINSRCVKSYDAALIEINKMSDLVIH